MKKQPKPRVPKTIYKIRHKETGLFVAKHTYAFQIDKHPFVKLSTTGKTFATLSAAMQQLNLIANRLDTQYDEWTLPSGRVGRTRIQKVGDRAWTLKTVEPYFELVEYEVRESRVINV